MTKDAITRRNRISAAVIGVLFSGGMQNLAAQTPDASGTTARSNSLEEIVVTARKRSESMQDVPVAINVLSETMIESLRIESLDDLASAVPGLQASATSGFAGGSIALRGISSGESSALIDQAVAINIDGVQVSDGRLLQGGLLDLQRIEIMRGPQALFFGKNSPGGVIALHTKDPSEEFEAMVSLAYETEAEEKVGRVMVSGPLTDTLKGRLFTSYSEQDGIYDVIGVDQEVSLGGLPIAFPLGEDTYPKREDVFALGSLVYEPSDNFKARFKLSYFDREDIGGGTRNPQRIHCPYGTPQAFIAVDDCKLDNKIYTAAINPASIAVSQVANKPNRVDGMTRIEVLLGSMQLDYELPDSGLTLTSVTGYYNLEQLAFGEASSEPTATLLSVQNPEVEQYSQEIRLASNWDSAFNFTTGLYLERKDSQSLSEVILAPFIGGGVPLALGLDRFEQEATSWSVFAEGAWEISETLTLSGGARYSDEKKKFDRNFNGVGIDQQQDNKSWSNVSPEATLSYRPIENVMFFASYRTGFKSGGFDASFKPELAAGGTFDFLYNEEEVSGFEVGVKSTWQDDTLALNITAFSYDYEDLQLDLFDPETTSLRIINAAEAKVEGLEIESTWATPVSGFTLRAGLNYLDATYDDFRSDCYPGQSIAMGCNLTPLGGVFAQQDLSGGDLSFAPEWSSSLGFDYETPLNDAWHLGLNGYATYTGSYATNTQNIPDSDQDSYWLANASVNVFSNDNTWEFFIRGVNLTDEFWVVRTNAVPLTGAGGGTVGGGTLPDLTGFANGGRRVTLGMTYRF